MTRSAALAGLGLRIGRWLFPWIAVLFVSATLAYAINGDIAGGSGPATVEQSTTSAQSADLVTPERCAPIDGSYVDSSIVREIRKIDCGWAP